MLHHLHGDPDQEDDADPYETTCADHQRLARLSRARAAKDDVDGSRNAAGHESAAQVVYERAGVGSQCVCCLNKEGHAL